MKYLFITSSIFFLFLFVSFGQLAGNEEMEIKRRVESVIGTEQSQLCGVNSLYLALRIFTGDKPNHSDLIKRFPEVREKGLNLEQLSQYFDEKGYSWKYARIGKKEIEKLNKKIVAFVLTKDGDNAHIHLMKKKNDAILQIADAPDTYKEISVASIGSQQFNCLLASKEKVSFPAQTNWIKICLSGCLILGGLGLCVPMFFKKKAIAV